MDFLVRIAIVFVAYLYPAYKCFKLIDYGKPKSEQLHVWCQYWIIIAIFTGCERVLDMFISWLPFYSGAKLAFVVYLWHPDTKGTEHIYQNFLKPVLSNNIECMEFNFGPLRDEAARLITILWTRSMLEIQARASEMLHPIVVESPSVAAQHVQHTTSDATDSFPLHTPVSALFHWSNLRQETPHHLGHRGLVTQSAIWSDEVYKKECNGTDYPVRSLIALPLEQPKQLNPVLNFHTLASQRDLKLQALAAYWPPSTGECKNNGSAKEETDFELVHFSEVPKPGSREATLCNNDSISSQGARSRWWW